MAVFHPLNANAMYTSETANGRTGKVPVASGAIHEGARWLPQTRPPTMNVTSRTPFKIANPSCVRLDQRRSKACDAVAATMRVIDATTGGMPGTRVVRNGPTVEAASATGAEKPTSRDVHPAKDPRNGCQRSER